MSESDAAFAKPVGEVLERYNRQNGLAGLERGEREEVTARLWELINRRGLPQPLRDDECGTPGEMTKEEVGPLVAWVLDGSRRDDLRDAVRQLVKACFHPEFKTCRESYREIDDSGGCRRQRLEKALGRVSGSHCVDCPYWTSLTAEQHAQCLGKGWKGDPAVLKANASVFLPEDFRALRVWLHAEARRRRGSVQAGR